MMELATQTHLHALRDALNYRLAELRAEVHAAQQARQESGAAIAHEVGDRKDDAAQQQVADVGEVQEQRDFDELARVEAALHRLDTGTYGDCTDCGESIPLQRLQVQPAAPRCATCQGAFERAQSRAPARSH